MMELGESVKQAIVAAAKRLLSEKIGNVPIQVSIANICNYEKSGFSGASLFRVTIKWSNADSSGTTDFIAKRWERSGWLYQLVGRHVAIERLLYDYGIVHLVNNIPGIHTPAVGSAISGGEAWIILEDVGVEISNYEKLVSQDDSKEVERIVVEHMARFHVEWESPKNQKIIKTNLHWLVPQDTRLRWLEPLYNVCIGGKSLQTYSPDLQHGIESTKHFFWEFVNPFLEWLPENDRSLWKRLMVNRDGLVEAAAHLPYGIIHGDFAPGNIGIRTKNGQKDLVLIDWQLTGVGAAPFDLIHFMSEGPSRLSDSTDLIKYYYDRYRTFGGEFLTLPVWSQALDTAIVHYRVSLFPALAGMVLKENKSDGVAALGRMIEQAKRAIGDLNIAN